MHRDLKPANIFINKSGRVKIGDFGVAKIINSRRPSVSNSASGMVVGTVWYMAPEQARAEPTDARADIYSLGCILFEMLSGRVPFDSTNIAEVLLQHLTSPLPPLIGPSGPVPEVVERIVQRAMAKKAEDRYQSADAMLEDLERALRAIAPREKAADADRKSDSGGER